MAIYLPARPAMRSMTSSRVRPGSQPSFFERANCRASHTASGASTDSLTSARSWRPGIRRASTPSTMITGRGSRRLAGHVCESPGCSRDRTPGCLRTACRRSRRPLRGRTSPRTRAVALAELDQCGALLEQCGVEAICQRSPTVDFPEPERPTTAITSGFSRRRWLTSVSRRMEEPPRPVAQ